MSKRFLQLGLLILVASCSRYSKVTELPKKDHMEANSRVYGDVGQPARQSKNPNTNPPDAAARAARIHSIMFGGEKEKTMASMQADGGAAAAAPAAPADTAAVK